MTLILPSAWIVVLLHFWVGISVYIIPKCTIRELEAPRQLLAPFEGEHLEWAQKSWSAPFSYKGKPLGSHMVGWNYTVHPDTPTMIGWIMGGRVHQKASARNVTHLSTILALWGLTSGSHGIRVKALGLSHPIGNKNHLKVDCTFKTILLPCFVFMSLQCDFFLPNLHNSCEIFYLLLRRRYICNFIFLFRDFREKIGNT